MSWVKNSNILEHSHSLLIQKCENFIYFDLFLWYSVDVFICGTLVSSRISIACRAAACDFSVPSWLPITRQVKMSFIHSNIIMLTLRPLNYSLPSSYVMQSLHKEN